jgi:hypothetical protein
MHLEGKLHQGYQKIRDKLHQLKEKQKEISRSGMDFTGRINGRITRSRSKDRREREGREKLM